jgi:hypothetical protein
MDLGWLTSTEFLKRHGIIDPIVDTSSSSTTSSDYHDAASAHTLETVEDPPDDTTSTSTPKQTKNSPLKHSASGITHSTSVGSQSFVPPSDSEESLRLVTKNSIEDLPSMVSRSPKTPVSPLKMHPVVSPEKSPRTFEEIFDSNVSEQPAKHSSPLRSAISPRRLFKKKLTVNINGTEFNVERKKRPLSPFNSGGMLRKLVPPSAPPSVTEFGPTVKDEVEKLEERLRLASAETPEVPKIIRRTTRTERGGRQLMGFLNKRLGKERRQED